MRKCEWVVLYLFFVFTLNMVYAVNDREVCYPLVSHEEAVRAELYFTDYHYSNIDSVDFMMKMEDYARVIIVYLIQSGRETPETLMRKFNEKEVYLWSVGPIIAFANGAVYFPTIPFRLKEYYNRHPGTLLVEETSPQPVPKIESHWYDPITSFFSSSRNTSVGSQSSRSNKYEKLDSGSDDSDKKKK